MKREFPFVILMTFLVGIPNGSQGQKLEGLEA
jgi:hypothetical protein